MKNKKVKKEEFIDDGRTISNMNVDGFSWYVKNKPLDPKQNINLTKQERRAIFKAMSLKMIPIAIIAVLSLVITFFLIKLWLS